MNIISFLSFFVFLIFSIATASSDDYGLSTKYYERVCPQALPTIKRVVEDAIAQERRMGASLLRLHFHDCFVNGCDASILLDQTSTIDTEKNAAANDNSARGFEVIDRIKSEVDKICGRPVVSCADILTVVARDSVVALGGPTWDVKLGRRDSTTASQATANVTIPSPFMDLPALIKSFEDQGLDEEDLVVLSGAHTLGFAQCRTFRSHIYNDTNIDPAFAGQLRTNCPQAGGDSNLAPLDPTPSSFDTRYFNNLVSKRGVLGSDQALFNGGETDELVSKYNDNYEKFFEDFAKSMIKMDSGLSTKYYDRVCPQALPTIKCVVKEAVAQERRMGASLLLFIFMIGCDASILLDQTSTIDSEKNAGTNANSARGFEVIDRIKSQVDKICGRPIVSCADILTIDARDFVVALGGPS
nr:heme peroxidase [Tanacetum cinerariifolium]